MSQPLVLAIEPDLRQAAILKRIVLDKALADLAVVDTRDAAIEAIRARMPDVLLLSALMSPRDEDELVAHLRTLDNAGHLQTHTIPQLASALGASEGRGRGLFSAFRRKKEPEPVSGCDPELFAEEIRLFLQHAAEKRRELEQSGTAVHVGPRGSAPKAAAQPEPEDTGGTAASSWESPFEWKPSSRTHAVHAAPAPAEAKAAPMPVVHEAIIAEPSFSMPLDDLDIDGAAPIAAEPAADVRLDEPVIAPDLGEPIVAEEPAPVEMVQADAEPILAQPLIPEPGVSEPLIVEPAIIEPPEIEPVHAEAVTPHPAAAEVIAAAENDPWVVHTPRSVTIEPLPMETAAAEAFEPLIEVVDLVEPRPAPVTEPEVVAIELDALVGHESSSGVHDRAVAIVARVQDEEEAAIEEPSFPLDEWTVDAPAPQDAPRGSDRLAPLSRWARTEPARKPKNAPVTADDVRALIASLAVPTAVASVTYPRGCRIRRVRVPPAPDMDGAEPVGAVILSRRKLAEQREKQPTA